MRAVDPVFLSDLLLPFGRSVPVMKAPRLSIFDLFLINRASTLIVNSSTYIWPQQVRILQILYFYLNKGIPLDLFEGNLHSAGVVDGMHHGLDGHA